MNFLHKSLSLIFPLVLLAKEPTVEQLFSVQTVSVTKEEMAYRRSRYGHVVADQSRIYDVTPRFGGFVERLYADKIYKKVKKGDILARVYSPEVFKAKDEYLNTYIYTKKRPNEGMLESARLKLELLGIDEEEITEVIRLQKASLYTTIRSPIDGYIFFKGIDKGSAFKVKQRLFQVVNLDEVWIEAQLFEEERTDLKKEKRYEVSFKGLEKRYAGTQAFLYPQLDPKVATLTLRLKVKNGEHLLFPGMYANIDAYEANEQRLILPSTAVIRKHGRHYVFLAGEFKGVYEPIEVKVKRLDAKTYLILDGLREGENVVENALFMLDADAQIDALY